MSIQAGKSTRAAKGRRNEDSVLVDKIRNFYAVADGVSEGGEGSTASRQAVAAAESIIKEDNVKLDELVNRLRQNITSGATTFTGVRIKEKDGGYFLEFAHLGDSKAFLVRDELQQLTHDDVVESGGLIKGLGREFEKMYKEKGIENEILPSYGLIPLQKGDKIVLASDGLDIDHETIKQIVKGNNSQKAADIMVKKSGREDDVSVIVIGIDSKEKTYSGSKIAVCTGIALIAAAAALAVGGWYLHRTYNKPASQKPGIEESLRLSAQQEEDAVFNMAEGSIYENLEKLRASKIAEIIKITDNREWYTNRADPSKPDKDELELKIIGNAWNIAGMKSIDRNNAYLRITTNDGKVYAVKFSDGTAEGHIKNNKPAEDVKWAEVVEPVKDQQGNYFLRVYATYDESQSKTKQASLDLDHLLDSYSKATLRSSEEVKKDMRGFEGHVNEIAHHYATHGLEDTLATYAMPDDNPEMLKSILKYAWGELGVRRKTSIKSLAYHELEAVKNAYYSGTNKKALEMIKTMTGMDMSESTMYAALDRLGGTEGRVYRKNIKEYHGGVNRDVLA